MKKYIAKLCFYVTILTVFNGCAYPTPYENFKYNMDWNIGKSADDSSSYIARYPQLLTNTRLLANGNIEQSFMQGKTCTVLFEIDSKTKVIF